jgi:perosamine synthetase
VDIEPDTWTIDPDCVRKAITPKTKAIMLVHSFGQPAEMDEIMAIAREYGLMVIEDAAPAAGSEYHGRRVGSFGDVACFSFQGAKMTVCGEGGMFLTDREDVYEKARLHSSMGRTDSQAVFWSDFMGYQYTMGNLHASLALAQLERAGELMEKKRALFKGYYGRLKDVEGIRIVQEKEGNRSNYCYPSILLPNHTREQRNDILAGLKALNIHARPAFPRMSRFPAFEARFPNPVATMVEEKGISLPAAANMTPEDVQTVCDSLVKLL